MGVSEEIGRTVRLTTASWSRTARLSVLLVVSTLAGAVFFAVRHLPLIMW